MTEADLDAEIFHITKEDEQAAANPANQQPSPGTQASSPDVNNSRDLFTGTYTHAEIKSHFKRISGQYGVNAPRNMTPLLSLTPYTQP